MPPAVLPSPPINRLSAATSRSSRDAAALAEGDCGAASGVRLADSACRSAAASFTGSPWPAMCMYMVAGEERSRRSWSAVIVKLLASRRLKKGFTSTWGSTRSPTTSSYSPIGCTAAHEQKAMTEFAGRECREEMWQQRYLQGRDALI